jgi:Flp pilus assembly protein TadB
VADVLSRHYGEGRLDSEELNERLERAMRAKTRGELRPLLADLPEEMPVPVAGPAGRRGPRPAMFGRGFPAVVVLLVVVAVLLAFLTAHHIGGFFLVAALILVYLRRRHHRDLRRWHSHLHRHATPHWHGPAGPVLADRDSAPPPIY